MTAFSNAPGSGLWMREKAATGVARRNKRNEQHTTLNCDGIADLSDVMSNSAGHSLADAINFRTTPQSYRPS
jgi:hypothetical protein